MVPRNPFPKNLKIYSDFNVGEQDFICDEDDFQYPQDSMNWMHWKTSASSGPLK